MAAKNLATPALLWTMHLERAVLLCGAVLLAGCAQIASVIPDEGSDGFGGEVATGGDAASSGGVSGSSTGGISATGGLTATGGTASTGGSTGTGGGGGGLQPVSDCTTNAECNDLSTCTTDVCTNGTCAYNDNASCECKPATAASDCEDGNECTTDTCQNNQCVFENHNDACTDDGDACTADVCSAGSCTHADSGTCSANTVVLRSMRDGFAGQWVSLNAQSGLIWNAASSLAQAELFDKEDVSGNTFKLKALSSGNYLSLGADAVIQATGDQVGALVFQSTSCPLMGGSGVGIQNTAGGSFAKAEGSGLIVSTGTGCNSDNAAAWERFELISTGN